MKAIYRPSGRALEYAPLAANLYRGCPHGCLYCYAPRALKTGREEFHAAPQPREGILDALRYDVEKIKPKDCTTCSGTGAASANDIGIPVIPVLPCERCNGTGKEPVGPVLLCFSCDPYQEIEREHKLTRQAIEILGEAGVGIRVLTKAPNLAVERDLDLLKKYRVEFGISAAFGLDEEVRRFWEAGAEAITARFAALADAHYHGVPTWVSLEPVLNPAACCWLIETYAKHVDFWRVGKLNHEMEVLRAAVARRERFRGTALHDKTLDVMAYEVAGAAQLLAMPERVWPVFLRDALVHLRRAGARYYIKDDLWAHADERIKSDFGREKR